jgi:hypothetical protein
MVNKAPDVPKGGKDNLPVRIISRIEIPTLTNLMLKMNLSSDQKETYNCLLQKIQLLWHYKLYEILLAFRFPFSKEMCVEVIYLRY